MKKLIYLVMTAVVLAVMLPFCVTASAQTMTDGNFTYELDPSDGTAVLTRSEKKQAAVVLPETVDGYRLIRIGDKAFEDDNVVKTIVLPNTMRSVGDRAFSKCGSLEEVDLGMTELLGDSAFLSCTKLKTVGGGEHLSRIGKSAFRDCTALSSIELSYTVRRIGENAFYNCTALRTIELPDEIEFIGSHALGYYKDTSDSETEPYRRYDIQIIAAPETVGAEYIRLNSGEVKSPSDASLGYAESSSASSKASSSKSDSSSRVSLWRKSSSSSSPSSSSQSSSSEYDPWAYEWEPSSQYEESSSRGLYDPEGNIVSVDGMTFMLDREHHNAVLVDCDPGEELILPETVDGYPLTIIGESAATPCYSLRKLVIPHTVTEIRKNAFANCHDLEEADLGSVQKIGDYAFTGCAKPAKINFGDRLESIGYRAFANCSQLNEVSFPDTLQKIGKEAFYECTELHTVPIPDGVKRIGTHAFGYHRGDIDGELEEFIPMDGMFVISGSDTVGTKYAIYNGFMHKIPSADEDETVTDTEDSTTDEGGSLITEKQRNIVIIAGAGLLVFIVLIVIIDHFVAKRFGDEDEVTKLYEELYDDDEDDEDEDDEDYDDEDEEDDDGEE